MPVSFLGGLRVCYVFTVIAALYSILRNRRRIIFMFTSSDADLDRIVSFFSLKTAYCSEGCKVIRKRAAKSISCLLLSWISRKIFSVHSNFSQIANYRIVY